MKKTLFIKAFIFTLALPLSAQTGPSDVVVLLDTSVGMSRSYEETTAYLTGQFLRDHLRIGDTFHLISFSREPRLEIIRKVEGVGDVETIIARMLLLYPLARDSDPVSAIGYAENYAASLSGGRSQRIILISAGNDPMTQNAVDNLASRLSARTQLHYIRTGSGTPDSQTAVSSGTLSSGNSPQAVGQVPPAAQTPSSSATAQVPPAAQIPSPLAAAAPQAAEQPSPSPAVETPNIAGGEATYPSPVQPPIQSAEETETAVPRPNLNSVAAIPAREETIAAGGSSVTASVSEEPPAGGGASTPGIQTSRSSAQEGRSSQPERERTGRAIPIPAIIALISSGLLALGLAMFFVTRRLKNSPNRVVAEAANSKGMTRTTTSITRDAESAAMQGAGDYSPIPRARPLPADIKADQNIDFENGSPLLSLYVEDQNTAIGRRNIHAVKRGYTFTVGGGKSDFLIFLVPVPSNIASLVFDGNQCTFVPKKPEFFPDLGLQQLQGCIGKTIRVLSDKNYELRIRVDRYEDPLIALNKLLNSIKAPGL